jgi:apolipoprotein D and lipocalin family protein
MRSLWSGLLFLPLLGCAQQQPIRTQAQVDLERFMGDWYVIANIPTWLEEGAHNAVESYRLQHDGRVATRFRFRDGAFDGPEKVYNPVGFVQDGSNAVWGMQFVWPIRAEYRIVYVDPQYQRTIIGRSARDYVWLMARSPELDPADYADLERIVAEIGYDPGRLRPVPQRWPEAVGSER